MGGFWVSERGREREECGGFGGRFREEGKSRNGKKAMEDFYRRSKITEKPVQWERFPSPATIRSSLSI